MTEVPATDKMTVRLVPCPAGMVHCTKVCVGGEATHMKVPIVIEMAALAPKLVPVISRVPPPAVGLDKGEMDVIVGGKYVKPVKELLGVLPTVTTIGGEPPFPAGSVTMSAVWLRASTVKPNPLKVTAPVKPILVPTIVTRMPTCVTSVWKDRRNGRWKISERNSVTGLSNHSY